MRGSWFVGVIVVLALVLPGCLEARKQSVATSTSEADEEPAPGVSTVEVTCQLRDESYEPLSIGSCRFFFDGKSRLAAVDSEGRAVRNVTKGSSGEVQGVSPGRTSRTVPLVADQPKLVEMVLPKPERPQPSSSSEPPPSSSEPTETQEPVAPTPAVPARARTWLAPVQVSDSGNEPHLAVDADGVVYYSPTSSLWKSTDGGRTFQRIDPGLPTALPTLGSDTSLSLAPDGSVWWSRYWGYPMTTIGCTSPNKGASWTCDNAAIPGVTDRMWIVGLDAQRGYLQTNEGLYHHVWAQTSTGSLKYVPYATATTLLAVRNGNIVYDAKNDAVWQIEWTGDTQKLLRIDGRTGLVSSRDTGVPRTYALPWLSVYDGTLWTTGEPGGGAGGVVVARSGDGGLTWDEFPVPTVAKSVVFSYVAAGPEGRVAVVYYGSDKAGPSTSNGGTWSLYVAETSNGLEAYPSWTETRVDPLIHKGNICIGLNCEASGGDAQARFSGDLIGIWIDADGNSHVAYNRDEPEGTTRNMYVRQT